MPDHMRLWTVVGKGCDVQADMAIGFRWGGGELIDERGVARAERATGQEKRTD